MRWEPIEGISMPGDDEILWRYMGFDKYARLVTTSSLWFPRSDKLGDRFEGSRTAQDLRPGQEAHVDHLSAIAHAWVHVSYVSCWSLSPVESMGLWKTFAGTGPGVAITTTVGKLRAALEATKDPFNAGAVRYIDYRREAMSRTSSDFRLRLFHKRQSFEHEQEFRVVMHPAWRFGDDPQYWLHSNMPPEANPHGDIPNPNTLPVGLPIELDLTSVIGNAFVSPLAPPWYRDAVKAVIEMCGLEFGVTRSDLDSDPVF